MKPGTTVQQLYEAHQGKRTTKWSGYLPEYDRLLSPYKEAPISLLEIGVRKGGSLEIWADYFPQARHLVGCEIDSKRADLRFEDPRIALVIGDASDEATKRAVLDRSPGFDIVIDDGSHTSRDIIKAFGHFFPALTNGGLYIVEDLHCSYASEFEGGGLENPLSSIAFFKALIDVVNQEHWEVERSAESILDGFFTAYDCRMDEETLQHIHAVEFINSLCIVRKLPPKENRLGPKVTAGAAPPKKRFWTS